MGISGFMALAVTRRIVGVAAVIIMATPGVAEPRATPDARKPDTGPRPTLRIEAAPLGFLPPAAYFLTYRLSSASLGFFDDNHLLFTFRVGGLLTRLPSDREGDEDQEIRAVVLDAKTGTVLRQTEWRMHDRLRYLWPLEGGQFLVRIRDSLYLTDETLALRHYVSFDAPVRSVDVTPDQRTIVVETDEPAGNGAVADGAGNPVMVRIFTAGSEEPSAVTRAHHAGLVPVMGDGLLATLEGKQTASWVIREVPFHGNGRTLAQVRSYCQPQLQPVSATVALVVGCYTEADDRPIVALSTSGKELWHERWENRYVWPWFGYATNGTRFLFESMEVNRPIDSLDALYPEDVEAQLVGVYDTETGKLVMVQNASPVLSADQNAALSPDGRRLAVLRDGAIEIYDLPPAGGAASGERDVSKAQRAKGH